MPVRARFTDLWRGQDLYHGRLVTLPIHRRYHLFRRSILLQLFLTGVRYKVNLELEEAYAERHRRLP